ncbi:MAG: fibronectin type III domain-containing protein [Treponema sp.]|jgi:uncharacterized protein involved in high-affinity Fe2+ transport|nr:fibronectin type III domain-containing protein [Treponema sp.]
MMKKLSVFALLLFLCSAFFSCFSPMQGDAPPDTGGQDEDEIYDDIEGEAKPISYTSFALEAVAGLSYTDTDSNSKGALIASLTVPEDEGPWTPELNEDTEENNFFELVEGGGKQYEIRIKDGALSVGDYKLVVQIENQEGKVFHRTVEFKVSETPAPFQAAPVVYPYITGAGKNKLEVRWHERPSGTQGYRLYVGITGEREDAQLYKEIDDDGADVYTEEITDIEEDAAQGYLPAETVYYVWVLAFNEGGEGQASPPAECLTSAAVQPYWYQNVKVFDCGYDDRYWLTPTTIQYEFGQGGAAGFNYIANIVYHKKWDPDTGKQGKTKSFPADKLKSGLSIVGLPAGVFIIKYLNMMPSRPYSACYYWGMGAGKDGNIACIVNQWNNYAETATFEEAMVKFTLENVESFIKLSPEPYIRYLN